MRIDQPRLAGQRQRHRVDREVTAGEVVREARGANGRQRARLLVELGARRREIDGEARHLRRSGAEPLVHARRRVEPARERGDVGRRRLDGDVEVDATEAQDQVPDGPAHQEERQRAGGVAHLSERRQRVGSLAQAVRRDVLLGGAHVS